MRKQEFVAKIAETKAKLDKATPMEQLFIGHYELVPLYIALGQLVFEETEAAKK